MEIIIKRKKVKRLTLTIKPTGEVIVSSPLSLSDDKINEFIKSNEKWIEKNYEKAIDKTIIYTLSEGSTIYLLGIQYVIRIISSNEPMVLFNGSFLDICVTENSEKEISLVFNRFLKSFTKKIVTDAMNKYLTLTNESINELKIKKLERSYGKCYFERRIIEISDKIIHKPLDFIEAVVLHEIAHLKNHNHQEDFYSYILKYMPDYKIRIHHLIIE